MVRDIGAVGCFDTDNSTQESDVKGVNAFKVLLAQGDRTTSQSCFASSGAEVTPGGFAKSLMDAEGLIQSEAPHSNSGLRFGTAIASPFAWRQSSSSHPSASTMRDSPLVMLEANSWTVPVKASRGLGRHWSPIGGR